MCLNCKAWGKVIVGVEQVLVHTIHAAIVSHELLEGLVSGASSLPITLVSLIDVASTLAAACFEFTRNYSEIGMIQKYHNYYFVTVLTADSTIFF